MSGIQRVPPRGFEAVASPWRIALYRAESGTGSGIAPDAPFGSGPLRGALDSKSMKGALKSSPVCLERPRASQRTTSWSSPTEDGDWKLDDIEQSN